MIAIPWRHTLHRACFIAACLFSLCLFATHCNQAAYAKTGTDEIKGLQETILALQRVHQKAGQDLQQQKDTGRLSVQEQSEYASFIGYIGGRVVLYCRELYQLGGAESLTGLSCPAGGSSIANQAPPSTEEEIAALDASLAESLGDFDEMLLAEEQKAAARQPRRSASGGDGGHGGQAGTGEGDGLEGEADRTSQSGQGQESRQGGEVSTSQSSTETSGGGRGGEGSGQRGSTGQSGQDGLKTDDDIVARQLREAAEKETDPELKKKLWEEYRKYKAGK